MSTPAVIYLALTFLGLGLAIAKHGEPRPPLNAWGVIIGTSVVCGLLYWGGFFS